MWILHQTSSRFTSKNHWITRRELKRKIKAAAERETTLQAVLGPARTALGRHAGPGEPTGAHPLTLAHSSHLHSAPLPTQPWRAEVWCRQSKSHQSISLRHGAASLPQPLTPSRWKSSFPAPPAGTGAHATRVLASLAHRVHAHRRAFLPATHPILTARDGLRAGRTLLTARLEGEGQAFPQLPGMAVTLSTEAGPKRPCSQQTPSRWLNSSMHPGNGTARVRV